MQLVFAVSELPDFRDIHTESAKRLADIANDPRSIFDDKTNIERAINIVLRLQHAAQVRAGRRVLGEMPGYLRMLRASVEIFSQPLLTSEQAEQALKALARLGDP